MKSAGWIKQNNYIKQNNINKFACFCLYFHIYSLICELEDDVYHLLLHQGKVTFVVCTPCSLPAFALRSSYFLGARIAVQAPSQTSFLRRPLSPRKGSSLPLPRLNLNHYRQLSC